MAYTPEEREAYLLDMTQQRDWLLLKILQIENETSDVGVVHITNEVFEKFNRPVSHTEEDLKDAIDLTPEAMLKERIESYAEPTVSYEQRLTPLNITTISEPKKELSIEDVFGTSDETYRITEGESAYHIKSATGSIIHFHKATPNAERKAKLALKLLNQCEPDDIDLLIEMLY